MTAPVLHPSDTPDATAARRADLLAALTSRWPSWLVKPCGTPAAFRRHLRHGEPVDEACRLAANADRAWRKRQVTRKKVVP